MSSPTARPARRRAAVTDLALLLRGHLRRYRTARLQEHATAMLRDPRRRWVIPAVNATIRVRRALTEVLYFRPRWMLSRAAYLRQARYATTVPANRLSLLCPTRGRPGGFKRLLESVHRTAVVAGRVEVLAYVDSDDPELPRYRRLFAAAGRRFPRMGECRLLVGEPAGVPAAWNALAAASTGDFLLMANDDQTYVDYGWDVRLDRRAAELTTRHADGVLCLYFDAGQYPEGGGDFPIVSRAFYTALGYYSREIFQQWQAERWIFDVARRAGRLYSVPDIFVAHLHYQDYTAAFDATYQRHRLTTEKSFADQALFIRTAPEREQEAGRLLRAPSGAAGDTRPPRANEDGRIPMAMPEPGTDTAADGGAGRYTIQSLRRYYGSLIDAWNYSGRVEEARECAEMAVRQGVWTDPLQRAREHLPGLSAQPLHDPGEFWFAAYLEEHYEQFRDEICGVLDTPIDPVHHTVDDGGLIRRGAWKQAHLFRDGRWQEDICVHFPVTRGILEAVPELTTFNPGVITVSRVDPGSHIMPHCGPTNALLRVHLPITIPPGVSIRVADRWLAWEEGKCLIFDDSFEHEVKHEGTEDRVVLILDTLHPQLGGSHTDRIRQRQLTTEEQIISFMRDGGYESIEAVDGDIVIHPEPALRDLVRRYMTATGIEGAELHGDEVVWQRLSAVAGPGVR
jgi:aspartyl/asparaginyl beta-hydroxylase (cupin superfamily)